MTPESEGKTPKGNISIFTLAEEGETAKARKGLVGWALAAVDKIFRSLRKPFKSGQAAAPGVIRDATQLAADAAAGKLHGASLEGDLKAAQIAEAYANARRANAEAESITEDAAWRRLERAIAMYSRLGISVTASESEDGTFILELGLQDPNVRRDSSLPEGPAPRDPTP